MRAMSPSEIENTRDAQHGDFASNLAMRLAKATRQNPRKLADALLRLLPPNPAVAKVEIAGAGFINFFLAKDAYHAEIAKVLEEERALRAVARGRRPQRFKWNSCRRIPRALCTSVTAGMPPSAPASPICSRPWAISVEREYYINDAGRQMEILAVSTWLRYLEQCGEQFPFPANGYRGEYIAQIGAQLFAAEGAALAAWQRGDFQGSAAGRA